MITFLDIEYYIMQRSLVTFDYPFDDVTRVYRIANKIFALIQDKDNLSINLKCDPAYGLELRLSHSGIVDGYHMNKKHWNTVIINSDVSQKLLYELISHSYELVVSKLPKVTKDSIFVKN